MKRLYFTIIAVLVAITINAQKIKVYEYDEAGNLKESPAYTSTKKVKVVFVEGEENDVVDGHEIVNIGGVNWATMNIGATTIAGSYETCCGDYFAWGETEPRYSSITRNPFSVTWKDEFPNGYDSRTTYSEQILDAAHDAATVNWGPKWRMPTNEDFSALYKATCGSDLWILVNDLTHKITNGGIFYVNAEQTFEPEYTGIAGLLFVDMSDITKRVFFPSTGTFYNKISFADVSKYASYWTAEKGYSIYFNWGGLHAEYTKDDIADGLSVRPICVK